LSVDPALGFTTNWFCYAFLKKRRAGVHRIQHQFNTHENNNRISAREHTGHANAKTRHRKKYVQLIGKAAPSTPHLGRILIVYKISQIQKYKF
jgi:hypothetical protein